MKTITEEEIFDIMSS